MWATRASGCTGRPATDDRALSYYEIRRDGQSGQGGHRDILLRSRRRLGPAGDVRRARRRLRRQREQSVDGAAAAPMSRSSLPRLGGHFAQTGRDGWRAETTADGRNLYADDLGATRQVLGRRHGRHRQPGRRRRGLLGRGQPGTRRTRVATGRSRRRVRRDVGCPAGGRRSAIVGRAMKEYYRRNDGEPLRVRILHG